MDPEPLLTFPKWSNKAALGVLAGLAILPLYVGILLAYGANPTTLNVGYAPVQPVPYSHALHVGKLGLDCRYCHTTVETAAMAAIPHTEVCMNCHKGIFANSPKLAKIRQSYAEGSPVPWIKVHDLPDYVYFDHSAHLTAGVGCIECHGPIQQMETVRLVKPLNMAWCLACHRNPAPYLRPRDQLTNMDWVRPPADVRGQTGGGVATAADVELSPSQLMQNYRVHPSTDCVTCHR